MNDGVGPGVAWVARKLSETLTELGGSTDTGIDPLAEDIATAMSGQNRFFHALSHLQDVSRSADPLPTPLVRVLQFAGGLIAVHSFAGAILRL